MSEENLERIRALYEHFNRTGEPDWALFDPEAEFDATEIPGLPRIALAAGKEELRRLLRDYSAAFEDWRIDPEQLLDADDHVVAVVRDGGRLKGSSDEVFNRFTHVWTFRRGRVIRWKTFTDQQRAFEAAGLSK